MKPETKNKLEEFLDELEEEYGPLEGLEIKLEHPIIDGEKQTFSNIKELNIYYLHKQTIQI